jgi:hypothetical protein
LRQSVVFHHLQRASGLLLCKIELVAVRLGNSRNFLLLGCCLLLTDLQVWIDLNSSKRGDSTLTCWSQICFQLTYSFIGWHTCGMRVFFQYPSVELSTLIKSIIFRHLFENYVQYYMSYCPNITSYFPSKYPLKCDWDFYSCMSSFIRCTNKSNNKTLSWKY